jgi:2-C-methyl-D-erythritol 2,4-cyclodiphosphate synthase
MRADWKGTQTPTFFLTRSLTRCSAQSAPATLASIFQSIRGISSLEILKRVGKLLTERNTRVVNVDATVIAEAPKLAPHAPAMRQNIAAAIGVNESDVSVKATTNEKLGPIGQGEGIAAIAIATVEID